MLQKFDVGFVSRRRRGRGLLMLVLHATRVASWSQYSHNMVATWGREKDF
jgi:hypothetical protein